MYRASSRTATSRANVVFPLPAQPTTTTRSRTGRVGTGRAIMPVTVRREGRWSEAVTAIGAPGLYFHDLRLTGNQLVADTGAGLRDLMARMGHDCARGNVNAYIRGRYRGRLLKQPGRPRR